LGFLVFSRWRGFLPLGRVAARKEREQSEYAGVLVELEDEGGMGLGRPTQMKRCLLVCFALVIRAECNRDHAITGRTTPSALFGLRGGGFWGRSKHSPSGGGGGDDGDGPSRPRFSALSQEEIEDKLNIPVYGLTDHNGNGIILSSNNENVFHFFFNKQNADAACIAVSQSNESAPDLKVSAFHLGKCWFRLINNPGASFRLQKYGGDTNNGVTKQVKFRLVPNMKDLAASRILTGLGPGDAEELKSAVMEQENTRAIQIIEKAQRESKDFTQNFNQIPVFAIAQMRVRKKDEEGNANGPAMLPFHLSTQTMADTWTEFIKHSPQFADAEATLQLIELHKMIDMMGHESDFDWRKIVFITNYDDSSDSDDESDEDDGGGGDFGLSNEYDGMSIEPYVSFDEVVADTNRNQLVKL